MLVNLYIYKRAYGIFVPQGPTAINYVNTQHENVTNSIKLRSTELHVVGHLFLLHNTLGDVVWAGEKRAGNALHLSSYNPSEK